MAVGAVKAISGAISSVASKLNPLNWSLWHEGTCICCICGEPGLGVVQYPGPIPYSDCFCEGCYIKEESAFKEWYINNPGVMPTLDFIPLLKPRMTT